MKEKGIVLSVNDHSAVIFTKQCRLIEISAPPNVSVGQEVFYIQDSTFHFERSRTKTPLIAFSMALAALFIGIFISQSILTNRTYAIISVDVNPSVQFLLNEDLVITEVHTLNSDAANLIAGEIFRGLTWQNGVDRWLEILESHGYEESERIMVAAALPNDDADLKYQLAALGEKGYSSEKMNALVLVVFTDDFSISEKASNSQLSIGMQILKTASETSGMSWDESKLKRADAEEWSAIISALDSNYNVSVSPTIGTTPSHSSSTQTTPQATAPSNSNATQTTPQATAPSNSNATEPTVATTSQREIPSNSNATKNPNGTANRP